MEEVHKLEIKIPGIETLMLLILATSSWMDCLIFQNLYFLVCKLQLLGEFKICKYLDN